jgi:subtilisin family serine protease
MKKTVIVSILLLAMLSLTMFSMPRMNASLTPQSLKYNVNPIKEHLFENYVEGSGGELEDPTPFWVDMVNGEYYPNGGEGVYVAVLDTGLLNLWRFFFNQPVGSPGPIKEEWGKGYTHDAWWDTSINDVVFGPLRDDRGFITDPFKGSGHGTHVASTIVGYNFNNLLWVRGVAPKAQIIPVLVLDAWEVPVPGNGVVRLTGGTDEMVSAGIRYVGDLAEREGVKIIINMSLGGSEPTAMIEDAIDYAIGKGVIVVAAAGNAGYDGMDWPGAYPQVISAAAGGWTEGWLVRPPQTRWWLNDVPEKLNTKDYWGNNWQMFLEDFSSRPNKDLGQDWKDLDVCTPGAAVVGPYKSYFSSTVAYYYLWGTSMATPHVSAIAAIVAQTYPAAMQADMEWILKKAATGLPLASDGAVALDSTPWQFWWHDHEYGTGWLTADQAMFKAFTYYQSPKGSK